MKYQDKLRYASMVLEEFCQGNNEESVRAKLNQEELSSQNIDSIMLTSKNLFVDKFQSKIVSEIDSEGYLVLIDELENTNEEWCQKYYEHTNLILENREQAKADTLVNNNIPAHIIANKTNQNFVTNDDLEVKAKTFEDKSNKDASLGYIGILGGMCFLGWFTLGLINGTGRTFFLILGLSLIYKGFSSLNKNQG